MQLDLFPRQIVKRKLPTNLTTNNHPIHRWFNFIAGFSPEFVQSCIRDADLSKTRVLIDPFAGLSTALVQANFEGISSVGFEPHPFFFDISQAKIDPPEDHAVVDAIESEIAGLDPYTDELHNIWSEDALKFLRKLIPEQALRLLAQALLQEEKINVSERELYRLVMSRILELTSRSQTDGIYKAPTTIKKSVAYHEAVKAVCGEIRRDIEVIGCTFSRQATLFPTSSESMPVLENDSCSICVTSPPYLNNFDFAEMTRMELYFWRYAGSWREITERVRSNLIVNTTTAPTDMKKDQCGFKATLSKQMRSCLAPLVESLEKERRSRAGKKDYYLLVYPYFSQMQLVFEELRRVLETGSLFHLVVADSALYGVHIQTQNLLASLMGETGFKVLRIEQLRKRGERWVLDKRTGAKKGLGEYHIIAKLT
ncbi:MAG: DNA methylase [Anaerolineae bacterium]|nr:DNA methylase [Anaerolineae bacterium]